MADPAFLPRLSAEVRRTGTVMAWVRALVDAPPSWSTQKALLVTVRTRFRRRWTLVSPSGIRLEGDGEERRDIDAFVTGQLPSPVSLEGFLMRLPLVMDECVVNF